MISAKNIQKIFFISILIIFFLLNFRNINYALPFFTNSDEIAYLTSSISYISFITNIEYRIIDPIVSPLLNIILILNLAFLNEIILNSLSLMQLKDKIYLNPELLIYYGRISSLIISTISLTILYLIFKKLKINFYVYFSIFISLLFSLFLTDISIVNGKNSYYLLFFLIQLYYLIKYLDNLDKFNLKSYLIFAILASLAYGTNYWSSIISFYGILVLHYKKYKFDNLKFVIYFMLIFIVLGFLPNYFLNSEFGEMRGPFGHIFGTSAGGDFSINEFVITFLNKILLSFQIISYTEIIFILFIILSIFYLFNNFQNKNNFIIMSILFLEPILIFSITADVIIQLRYLTGLICLMYILLALIINDLLNKNNFKKIITIFFIFNVFLAFSKSIDHNRLSKIAKNNHSFYNFYLSNNEINNSTLYISNDFFLRSNLQTLLLYKDLHEKDLIKANIHKKYSVDSVLNKINKIKNKNENLIISKNLKKDFHVFDTGSLDINNFDYFFNKIKKNYKFIVIDNKTDDILIKDFIKNNFNRKSVYYEEDNNKIYFENLRKMFRYVSHGNGINENLVFGNNYELYELF